VSEKGQGTAETVQRGGAVVIGAGPAGLTAAFELRTRTDLPVTVFEATDALGGISQTVVYRGNRMDIGGHRFFSKSDRVLDWWLAMMPPEAEGAQALAYQGKTTEVTLRGGAAPIPPEAPAFMLRPRSSRIFFAGRFFDYPVTLTPDTLRKLGLRRTLRIGTSYLRSALFPVREPENLEEFFVNRFGRELYETFFRDYTEKVWGVPCTEIPADWGAQRVKGLSVGSAISHFLRSLVGRNGDARQKGTETSLIEQFLYPRRGPGEMWEVVAGRVEGEGGQIRMRHRVDRLVVEGNRIAAVEARDEETGRRVRAEAPAFVVSTMPIRSLVRSLDPPEAVPEEPRAVAEGLVYRDFLIVGLLLKRLAGKAPREGMIRDNWIYIQEPGVLAGRLQVFNNWSPYLVADPDTAWVGVEYFCNEGDPLWTEEDDVLRRLAVDELTRIGLAEPGDVLDGTVVRMPKAYPSYIGTYDRFETLRVWLDGVENLALVGRNGMHRYNNQDHSMLTAMTVVDQLVEGRRDPAEVWGVNTEQEYHEEK
jgi:protoporphyrinogen oxidase